MKRPQRAITTVKPLNSAVRPAVAPCVFNGRVLVQAAGQFVPVAGYYDEGVVYPNGQPDHNDHERDKEYELKDLAYESRNAQRYDDADYGQPYGR